MSATLSRSVVNYGLRLSGTPADIAALHTLVEVLPGAADAPWTELVPAVDAPAYALTSDRVDLAAAQRLRAHGVDVARLVPEGDALTLSPLRRGDAPWTWPAYARRDARSLLEALRPRAIAGDPPADEATLWIPLDGDGAQRTIARLMDLGRDDVSVAIVDAPEGRALVARLHHPPLYLLMRAREEPAEGVCAYARHRDSGLWVRWGYAHPLADVAADALRDRGLHALVDADGRWRYVDAGLTPRSIYDVLEPRLDARRSEVRAAPEVTRFRVRMRLEGGPVTDPELWLLDADEFLALEPLVESLSTDEARRFTLARLEGERGPTYLLQELVRPNVTRLAARVSGVVDAPGYARAAGADNLFLPVGRRLMPPMRRDELRALLGLEGHRAVILTEDGDGVRLVAVSSGEESPLSRWVEYVATDRRAALDRLAEESVFEWLPEVSIERPPRAPERVIEADTRERAPAPPRAKERAPRRDEAPKAAAREPDRDELALRAQAAPLEQDIARGGCVDADTWRALGHLKARLRERDDGCACLEAALFYGALDAETAAALAATRAQLGERKGGAQELAELVAAKDLTTGDAAYLGARVLDLTARDGAGERGAEEILHESVKRFADPDLPVSRRLAWAVLRAVFGRRDDRLGLTRAKERILGGINDRGLSEATDVPRFVRAALAAQAGMDPGSTHGRGDQLAALEALWSVARGAQVRELEPKGAYVRLIFAVGFTRLGALSRAKDITAPLDAELPVHEPPNRALFALYAARAAHVATGGDEAAWKREVDAALAALKDQARVRDKVEWLRKRSEWLRTGGAAEATATIRAALERALAEAEADPTRLSSTLAAALDGAQHYDYEVTAAVERAVRAAMRAGNDDALGEVLAVAARRLGTRVTVPGHRARAIGACIRGAAAMGDVGLVDQLLDQVIALAEAPRAPYIPDLLEAVAPALSALRRLGVGASARRFLDALAAVAARAQGGAAVQLRAAVADGLLQLREAAAAEEELAACVALALEPSLDPVERFKAARDVLGTMRHFPLPTRMAGCQAILEGLDRFTDTFTASQTKLYETHKVLVLERVVDAIADDVTFASDRVRAFLDDEEQEVRRRILSDWRAACGR